MEDPQPVDNTIKNLQISVKPQPQPQPQPRQQLQLQLEFEEQQPQQPQQPQEQQPQQQPQQNLYTLNEEQEEVIKLVEENKNIFITGVAGTGKSFLIKQIKRRFELNGKKVVVTSLTGLSALLIGEGARTIHSWSGLGIGNRSVLSYFEFIRKCLPKKREAWRTTDILIIDEISMMSDEFFEKLDELGRLMRWKHNVPFGGIQILCFGDFLQLPPINSKFVFESPKWNETLDCAVFLNKIYRQKDPVFQNMLNEIRFGHVSKETDMLLKSRLNLDFSNEEIQPTKIFTRKAMVEEVNKVALDTIDSEIFIYNIITKGKVNTDAIKNALDKMDKSSPYVSELVLKVGAQVMLTVNLDIDLELVNGKLGIVTDCKPDCVLVRFKDQSFSTQIKFHNWILEDYESVYRSQIPLILSYAITTHKCIEGSTLLNIENRGLVPISKLAEEVNAKPGESILINNINIIGADTIKPIVSIYRGFKEKAIHIQTNLGYELTGSIRHPILVYNSNQNIFSWKLLPDIKIGDKVYLKLGSAVGSLNYIKTDNFDKSKFTEKNYQHPINIPTEIDEDIAYMFGLLIGDGCLNSKTYRIEMCTVEYDIEILQKLVSIIKEKFNKEIKINEVLNRKTKTYRIYFHSQPLIRFIEWAGFEICKAIDKHTPWSVLEGPISVQKAFIRGLYDTDGGINKNCIHFTNTSEKLCKELQVLLGNIGIQCSKNTLTNNSGKNHNQAYRINIYGNSARKFVKEIGFYCKRKMEKAIKQYSSKGSERLQYKSQTCEVPNGIELIKSLKEELKNGNWRIPNKSIRDDIGKFISSIINGKQMLRYENIKYLCEGLIDIDKKPSGKILKYLSTNNLICDSVKSIIEKNNIEMYDLEVLPPNDTNIPEGRDFIGGLFVNHNSQGATLDSAYIDIGMSVFEYGQAYVALSRVKSLDALYLHSYDKRAIRAHPTVVEYYETLLGDDE